MAEPGGSWQTDVVRSLVFAGLLLSGLLGAGCAYGGSTSYRSLHYVDGELVASRPVSSAGYSSYIRARIALEEGHLDNAKTYIDRALRYDPKDPHLWTTRAEIAAKAGDDAVAMAAIERALEIRPGYPPARSLMATLRGGPSSAATKTY